MKLMYSPGACSVGIHVLLEEIGKPYDVQLVNLREGAQFKPEFTTVNPKSKVPTLVRDDGSVLTEYPAIAYWLARTNPDKKLLRASNYTPNPADEDKVKERGTEMVQKGFQVMDQALAGKNYLAGAFSIADSALFYVEFWGAKRMNMALPPNCTGHLDRMMARPAVQRVMRQEGLN